MKYIKSVESSAFLAGFAKNPFSQNVINNPIERTKIPQDDLFATFFSLPLAAPMQQYSSPQNNCQSDNTYCNCLLIMLYF